MKNFSKSRTLNQAWGPKCGALCDYSNGIVWSPLCGEEMGGKKQGAGKMGAKGAKEEKEWTLARHRVTIYYCHLIKYSTTL